MEVRSSEILAEQALMSYRATVTVPLEPPVTGVGDSTDKKQAERLAALAAVYQLQGMGIVRRLILFLPLFCLPTCPLVG